MFVATVGGGVMATERDPLHHVYVRNRRNRCGRCRLAHSQRSANTTHTHIHEHSALCCTARNNNYIVEGCCKFDALTAAADDCSQAHTHTHMHTYTHSFIIIKRHDFMANTFHDSMVCIIRSATVASECDAATLCVRACVAYEFRQYK